MNDTEDAYFERALGLHLERDRLLASSADDAAVEAATRACATYLDERVPVTLRRRIRDRLRLAGIAPAD